ncbi:MULTISPECIES: proline/glycine betaine ABC transporter permease [unclassified Vibrio]|uniref:ABC transporter permease n=1 Tax=Vibrio sp. HB236076 TaxID=3232307 RepID=A0AB39HIS6_9VIBR|nr:proline/glycine betaine ABC transporter permease [Vibrio sp. HB161653]MDP5255022.1 proline/glycine betaine ABC transporter permease [Vibrio sp. HB161653]
MKVNHRNEYQELDDSSKLIEKFTQKNSSYYKTVFSKIHASTQTTWSFNWTAALLGPLWAATRSIWGFFWLSSMSLLIALTLICQGSWGNLGADKFAQAERMQNKALEMKVKSEAAIEHGSANAQALARNADNLQKASIRALSAANEASLGAKRQVVIGLCLLIFIMITQGFIANPFYERQYCLWRQGRIQRSGFKMRSGIAGSVLLGLIFPLTLYRFTAISPKQWLVDFPADKTLFNQTALWLNSGFDYLAILGSGLFDQITRFINNVLSGLETVLVSMPWPVVMMLIVLMSWKVSGYRAAIFTAIALSYLAFFGYWQKSMATVALLGTAAMICIVIGVPLGIVCAKNKTIDTMTKPVLDFMQTMPAFVYLIPIIAFFGTGKPPGVLATIVFGMPPVVRLTTLGIQQVPQSIVEGAVAFGCSKRKLLLDVEIPLAKASILAGVNQTILMCLSMVVIASLIGAQGLGTDVLQALQFAAKGQGLLAGLAILFCAIMIDRIVQGCFKVNYTTK